MLKDLCPGSPHHGYLAEPHCERGALFSCLREDDRAALLMLPEKVRLSRRHQ